MTDKQGRADGGSCKNISTDTEYQGAWSDSRTPEPEQPKSTVPNTTNQAQSVSPISEVAKSVTDNTAEISSALGGIFDISSNPSFDETAEEEEFRRLMQQKKGDGCR